MAWLTLDDDHRVIVASATRRRKNLDVRAERRCGIAISLGEKLRPLYLRTIGIAPEVPARGLTCASVIARERLGFCQAAQGVFRQVAIGLLIEIHGEPMSRARMSV